MCDDCRGTNIVPLGFYAGFREGIGANPQTEACRRCTEQPPARRWFAALSATMITLAMVRRLWQRA